MVRGDAPEPEVFEIDLEEHAGVGQRREERSFEAEGTVWRHDTKGDVMSCAKLSVAARAWEDCSG